MVLDEQVDVVWHHLQRHDLPPPSVCLGSDQLVQALRDPATEDRTAELREPHDVQPGGSYTPENRQTFLAAETHRVYEQCPFTSEADFEASRTHGCGRPAAAFDSPTG
ncbi:hypothetical protein GCM10009662_14590 [Catellatospora coxensis]|uniref:Uncharacterized protein n=1 Tax=Catellatospora coxensis TaxID=310354 RepID=A0A8J3P7S6_9ACTN|nr:hypothetical protein Cco03nite_16310 [Catellatospora coxensis]